MTDSQQMSRESVHFSQAFMFLAAGYESTMVHLSLTSYLLLKNPDKLALLRKVGQERKDPCEHVSAGAGGGNGHLVPCFFSLACLCQKATTRFDPLLNSHELPLMTRFAAHCAGDRHSF